MTGAADPLETASDARRALDLDDKVDCTHVDPELETRRRDQRRQPSGFELLLDLEPLLAGDAAVMRPDELLARELVESLGEALREPTAVREHDGAAMTSDQLEDPGVDGRPDARPQIAPGRRATGLLVEWQDLPDRRHVVHRDDDLEVERLARAGIDDRHVPVGSDSAEEPADRLERPLRGGQADPLDRPGVGTSAARTQRFQTLERQRQMRSPFRAGDRMDLVDDDDLDATQRLAGGAREHQVERLGRGDQDVGRMPRDLPPIVGRGVTGPARHADARNGLSQPLGRHRDPGERRPEVPLDVVGQRLQW